MWHWLVFAVVAGAAAPAPEQHQPTQYEEKIVVTASLEEEAADELPASVSVVERKEIRARRATEVFEMLRTVPGLDVVQSGSPGSVVSLFLRGAESNQTLVLWNGLPLNDPFFGGFDFAFLPTDGVRRIEVVRGPFSALYGSQAMGGVVQVLSGGLAGGSARVEAGSNEHRRLGVAWGEDLGRAEVEVAGHLRRGEGEADNDFFDSEELMARLEWSVGESASVGLLARAADAEIGIPTSAGVPTPRRRQESERIQLAVPIAIERGRWAVDASLSHLQGDFLFTDVEAFFSRSESQTERLRGRAVVTFRSSESFWLAVGGEWQEDEVSSRSNFGVDLEDESRHGYGLFAELYRAIGPLRLDVGLRYDEDEFFGSASSPRAGLVVELGRGVQLFGSYGEGFRAPSLGELFFPFFGNPDLEAEESESLEAGIRFDSRRWSLGLIWFSTDFENLIETDPLSFTAINLGRAESRGVELEIGYERGIAGVWFNATALDTEALETGDELLRRPEERANLVVAMRPGGWVIEASARYVGERADLDPVTFARTTNDEYVVGDLAVTWEASERWSPYARLRNVTDEAYEEVLGFPAPGRTAILGLEVGLP